MKKSNLLLSILIMFFISCKQTDSITEWEKEIINADKSMSELASKIGFNKAIESYADTNIVKLVDGSFPIIGIKSFKEKYANNAGTKSLSWSPEKVVVAKSGDIGYTWGNWIFKNESENLYGNYFTVWKRQPDGLWKVALDGGNSTPAPVPNRE